MYLTHISKLWARLIFRKCFIPDFSCFQKYPDSRILTHWLLFLRHGWLAHMEKCLTIYSPPKPMGANTHHSFIPLFSCRMNIPLRLKPTKDSLKRIKNRQALTVVPHPQCSTSNSKTKQN